jgi:hypothetical protein
MFGSIRRNSAIASAPSISGIRRSISTTSGCNFCTSASASFADPAVPVTEIFSSLSSMVRNPRRTTGWSSTINTLIAVVAPAIGVL